MPKKSQTKKQVRPCALCYGELSEGEVGIHDSHRDTELGRQYLASLDRPRIRPAAKPNADKVTSRRGRPSPKWLTKNEEEVVSLMIAGYTLQEIAEKAGTSTSAISSRQTKARRRVKAKTLYQLIAIVQDQLTRKELANG